MLLSEERRSRYRELQQALDEIKITVSQNNLDGAAVAAKYRKVQQFFANQIMAASSELDLQETPPEQPYLTEIHKQLRLLGTDVTFCKRRGSQRQPQQGKQQR